MLKQNERLWPLAAIVDAGQLAEARNAAVMIEDRRAMKNLVRIVVRGNSVPSALREKIDLHETSARHVRNVVREKIELWNLSAVYEKSGRREKQSRLIVPRDDQVAGIAR